jgi:tryptophan synthase alpha chain
VTGTAVEGRGGAAVAGMELEATLRARRDAGRKLLVPYLMAGLDDDWVRAVEAVVAAGADAVELGLPFSDPMIDGPVIQAASVAALRRGVTPTGLSDHVPVVAMTYYNLVYRAGHRRMARTLAAAGVRGAILPDLPLEELGPWAEEADPAGVATVLLVAPSTPEDRAAAICDRARGFVYAVARMGVTGERATLGAETAEVVARVRRHTDRPVLVGVGVSTPEQAVQVSRSADGVIVGSALVRRLLEGGGPEAASAFVGELRAAIDGG